MSGKNDMLFLNKLLTTSDNSINSRYWDIVKHKITQQEVLWYSTVTVVSTWQDELVSCREVIYCWCRCRFVNCYNTQNLSMPLFPNTECRTTPTLFCNHYYYELFIKPGECADTLANPCCIFAEVRNYSDLQCCPMSNLCRPMFEIFVSQYIEIYMGYIPPFLSKAKGLDCPSPLQITLYPNITDLIMPPLDMQY